MTQSNQPATAIEVEAIAYGKPEGGWRRRLFKVVFESDTPAGRIFDMVVIAAILLSVAAVMVDSVESVAKRHGTFLNAAEWMFTILFTIEYIARLVSIKRPLRYALSFFGIVDLIAVLPTYLAILYPEAQALIDVRILRLLRCFRIFKLTAYL